MIDHRKIRLSTLQHPIGTLFGLMLILFCLGCTDEEPSPFSAHVDGYNHFKVSNEDLHLQYFFAYTEPKMNHVFPITDDSLAMELRFHKDSLSAFAIEFFIIKFHYDKSENTISNVSLFAQELYENSSVDTIIFFGEYVPAPSGMMARFVPLTLKVSDVRYSPENDQISFDYSAKLEGRYNSLNTMLDLSGTLMAKCGPD